MDSSVNTTNSYILYPYCKSTTLILMNGQAKIEKGQDIKQCKYN
jgi:hypothetical protein